MLMKSQIGSGFYEQDLNFGMPFVVQKLDEFVKDKNYFKPTVARNIVVNRDSAGQMMSWHWKGQEKKTAWTLYDVKDPIAKSMRNFMHAKYICIASTVKERKGDKNYRFYVGSGNLSRMGLFSAYGQSPNDVQLSGNIEAGIVFDVESKNAKVLLEHGKKIRDCSDFKNDVEESPNKDAVPVCPIVAFVQERDKLRPEFDNSVLKNVIGTFDVETENGFIQMSFSKPVAIQIPAANVVAIHVIWNDYDYWIPVVLQNGNLPAAAITATTLDDLSLLLDEFPDAEEPEDDGDDDGVKGSGVANSAGYNDQKIRSTFPIQSAMNFIEKIARRNESITDSSLDDWIDYLKRIMCALPKSEIDKLRAIRVNFLSVLKEDGFAPANIKKKRRRWNQFVDEMNDLWKGTRSISLVEG